MTTITIPRVLLEQALDATERAVSDGKTYISECRSAASALRAALAAPASKPLFAELIAQHEGLAEELAAMDAPPAWHDAPTCAGLWVRAKDGCFGAYSIHESAIPILKGSAARWYGPISPDTGNKS